MTDVKQTVTRTEDNGVDETGSAVEQQTERVQTETKPESKTMAVNIIWYILGLIEVLLAFRLFFKLFGANPNSGFVNFIYSITDVLTKPFDLIFGVQTNPNGSVVQSVFEPSIIMAGIVYLLIAWGIVKLIKINDKD